MDNFSESSASASGSEVDISNVSDHLESALDDPKSIELSTEFVGRWSTLISTTNWEKGRIICEWREALSGSLAPANAFSDEAWSRRVGGVSAQHVGRLRRVYERFGESFHTYPGIYWSHFLAALDWDDAEMWLQGAADSNWSVTAMRRVRWESTGADPSHEPTVEVRDITEDEDFTPLAEIDDQTGASDAPRSVAEGPRPDGPDFGDEFDSRVAEPNALADDDVLPWDGDETQPSESPFAKLPSLPVDLSEALEQFKLAIIRHRTGNWTEVSESDVQKALDALKAFAAL